MADVHLRVLSSSAEMTETTTRVLAVSGERATRLGELTARYYSGGLVRVSAGGAPCTLPAPFAQRAGDVRAMTVHDDDVWVVTPPKCGSTWMQELVWLLMNNLDFDAAKATPLVRRFPLLEHNLLLPNAEAEEGPNSFKDIQNQPSPRCINSHLPKHLLPEQLWTKKAKIIYVSREVKDAAVSNFHHDRLINGYTGNQDFYFECFMENLILYNPFWEHVLEFWAMRKQPNICFTTYEDMKKDLPNVIRKTAKFLGRDVTEEQVGCLAEHLDFRNMRDNPAVNLVPQMEAALGGPLPPDQSFLRRGEVGDGRRQMAPAIAARFDSWSRQRLAGSDFPWLP